MKKFLSLIQLLSFYLCIQAKHYVPINDNVAGKYIQKSRNLPMNKANASKKNENKRPENAAKEPEHHDEVVEIKDKKTHMPEYEWSFGSKVELPLNVCYMLLGIPICFQGYKYLRETVILVGTLGGNIFILLCVTLCWDWYKEGNIAITCVIIGCFLIGQCFGIMLYFLPRLGMAVTGLVSGGVIGMQFYGIICTVKESASPGWMCLVLILCGMLAGIGLGVVLGSQFFLITSSYLGAYLVIRGLGNLIGNYPNVLHLTHGEKIPYVYLIYTGVILATGIIGYIVQICQKKKYGGTEEATEFVDETILKLQGTPPEVSGNGDDAENPKKDGVEEEKNVEENNAVEP